MTIPNLTSSKSTSTSNSTLLVLAQPITLSTLKKIKNMVIGNSIAKVQAAQEEGWVRSLVECLNNKTATPNTAQPGGRAGEEGGDALRVEAAHVIASLAYGSNPSLHALLRANAHNALLYSLSHLTPSSPPSLVAALTRAFRAVVVGLSDVVGPGMWGLKPEVDDGVDDKAEKDEAGRKEVTFQERARQALGEVFREESLDIWLPFLVLGASSGPTSSTSFSPTSHSTSAATAPPTFIAQLIYQTTRTEPYRRILTDWQPPRERELRKEREKEAAAVKSRRGWEKTPAISIAGASSAAGTGSGTSSNMSSAGVGGGAGVGRGDTLSWVVGKLLVLLGLGIEVGEDGRGANSKGKEKDREKDMKLVEAALSALANLARENNVVANWLSKLPVHRHEPALAHILAFTKSRVMDVQLGACLCLTHILRASTPSPFSYPTSSHHYPHLVSHHPHPHISATSPSTSTHHGHGHHPHGHQPSTSASASSVSSPGHGHGHGGHMNTTATIPGQSLEEICTRTVMNIVNRILGMQLPPSSPSIYTESAVPGTSYGLPKAKEEYAPYESKTKACYILHHLVADDANLCHAAFDRGSVDCVGGVLRGVCPPVNIGMSIGGSTGAGENLGGFSVGTRTGGSGKRGRNEEARAAWAEWEEGEPEAVGALREAALIALASLSLSSDLVRRKITDDLGTSPSPSSGTSSPTTNTNPSTTTQISNPSSASPGSGSPPTLLTNILLSLRTTLPRNIGSRYAACQCVRALSRSVSVLRTGIVDSGLGMEVLKIVVDGGWRNTTRGKHSYGTKGKGKWRDDGNDSDVEMVDEDESEDEDANEHGVDGEGEGATIEMEQGLQKRERKLLRGEDRRVLAAALMAVCNIVNDFSSLRGIYLAHPLVPRLTQLVTLSSDPALRLNSLWAIKNLIRKTGVNVKRDIMDELGWDVLVGLFTDPDCDIQEQAFNVLRNLSENEDGISLVFEQLGTLSTLSSIVEEQLSSSVAVTGSVPSSTVAVPSATSTSPSTSHANLLFDCILRGLCSPCEDVVLQSSYALANLANGTYDQQEMILRYPGMLRAVGAVLEEGGPVVGAGSGYLSDGAGVGGGIGHAHGHTGAAGSIRRPIVSLIWTLAKANPRRRKEMQDAGIVGTLKRLCEWSGAPGHGHGHSPVSPGIGIGHYGHAYAGGGGTSMSPPALVAAAAWGGRSASASAGGSTSSSGPGAGQTTRARSTSTSMSVHASGAGQQGSWPGLGTAAHLHSHSHFHNHYHSHWQAPYAHAHGHTPGSGAYGVGAGANMGVGTGMGHHSHISGFGTLHASMSIEDEKDVIQRARAALEWLEHGETYSSASS